MSETKTLNPKNKNTPNISVHYYTDPVYGSASIYGFEEYAEDKPGTAADQSKEKSAPDEPVESWGWINNVD